MDSQNSTYVIELDRWSIKNDGTNPIATLAGIKNAIAWAKSNKYSTVYLGEGLYSLEVTGANLTGIAVPSNLTFEMHPNCILKVNPNKQPDARIINLTNSDNTTIIGGQLLGDRYDHDYGAEFVFESGSIDATGKDIADATKLRSKGFIQYFKDGTQIPVNVTVVTIQGVKKSTSADLKYSLYCYDSNNVFITSFIDRGYGSGVKCPDNTKKYRIVLSQDTNENTKLAISNSSIYPTHEFGYGISILGCSNIRIKNTKITNFTGDCICLLGGDGFKSSTQINIEDCILDGSRRQGISIVDGRYINVRRCLIQNIRGTDPQSGIDIEHYGIGNDILVEDSTFKNNYKYDIINYNGVDLTIRQCKFDGSVGNTFGYNLTICDNIFSSKIKDGDYALVLNSNNKTNKGSRYDIHNNTISNYPVAVGFIGGVDILHFNNNTLENTPNKPGSLCLSADSNNCYFSNNRYISTGSILYSNNGNYLNVDKEFYYRSRFGLSGDDSVTITNCIFEESTIILRGYLSLVNCCFKLGKLSNIKSICDDSSFFTRTRTFEMIGGSIQGETKDPAFNLISGMSCNTFFKNVTFNIDRCMLFVNYGFLEIDNCYFTFPNRYSNPNIVGFITTVYGDSRSRISNCHFKNLSDGSFTIGATYISGCKLEGKAEKITNSSATNDIVYLDLKNKNKALKQYGNGTTAQRPIYASLGQNYFDSTLNKPIWCKTEPSYKDDGSILTKAVWVDANGTVV